MGKRSDSNAGEHLSAYSYERIDFQFKSRHRARPEVIVTISGSVLYLASGERLEFSHAIGEGQHRVYAQGLKKIIITGREDQEEFDECLYDDLRGTNQIFTR